MLTNIKYSYEYCTLYDSGENEAAIEILAGLKSNVLSWWEEDAAEDWAEEYYSYYIKKIDALINKMVQE
ncbi:MAG: hypothetical protein J6U88_00110 [Bacteroidales bacterium]|nr:hypothetical protein [Bacteroidales bacterium]